MRSSVTVLFTKCNQNTQVKENEMSRAYSTDGGQEECIYDLGGKGRRKETTRNT
jgi:hypothetical protein